MKIKTIAALTLALTLFAAISAPVVSAAGAEVYVACKSGPIGGGRIKVYKGQRCPMGTTFVEYVYR